MSMSGRGDGVRRETTGQRCARRSALGALLLLLPLAGVRAASVEVVSVPTPLSPEALPPLPSPVDFPIQLVLDDDGAEGSVGVTEGQGAKQFLFANRFTTGGSFVLEEIWVLFPATVPVGSAIELLVYTDADGNPVNGATLVASLPETVQVADGQTFSIYSAGDLELVDPGDVWLGVVPRYIVSGVTPPQLPAAIDGTASQGRSWIGVWTGDPPAPPTLTPVPDAIFQTIDGFTPGNWMIRGFGRLRSLVEIPAAGPAGLAALVAALAAAGFALVRRRARG
jgi:hypothetical protein